MRPSEQARIRYRESCRADRFAAQSVKLGDELSQGSQQGAILAGSEVAVAALLEGATTAEMPLSHPLSLGDKR